ncbi:hypothetical protein ISS07_02280 [Candidatus Woesearchaeota archaeon]|nr:hypothetical protein [Candidatus Woesearchaeota archaeon]
MAELLSVPPIIIPSYSGNNINCIVEPSEERPFGTARVEIKKCDKFYTEPVKQQLRDLGLKVDDYVAHLLSFFPNGGGKEEEISKYTRHGVGSKLLDSIVEDSLERNAKGILVFSFHKWMDNFLSKKKFVMCHPSLNDFYKSLQPI